MFIDLSFNCRSVIESLSIYAKDLLGQNYVPRDFDSFKRDYYKQLFSPNSEHEAPAAKFSLYSAIYKSLLFLLMVKPVEKIDSMVHELMGLVKEIDVDFWKSLKDNMEDGEINTYNSNNDNIRTIAPNIAKYACISEGSSPNPLSIREGSNRSKVDKFFDDASLSDGSKLEPTVLNTHDISLSPLNDPPTPLSRHGSIIETDMNDASGTRYSSSTIELFEGNITLRGDLRF